MTRKTRFSGRGGALGAMSDIVFCSSRSRGCEATTPGVGLQTWVFAGCSCRIAGGEERR